MSFTSWFARLISERHRSLAGNRHLTAAVAAGTVLVDTGPAVAETEFDTAALGGSRLGFAAVGLPLVSGLAGRIVVELERS